MSKTLYLIRARFDGGRSDQIAASLTVPFISKTYGIDVLPWHQISTVPCVVVDIDGTPYRTFDDRPEAPIDLGAVTTAWAATPATIQSAVPVARVTTINTAGIPKTVFKTSEAITIKVEMLNPAGTQALTNFEVLAGKANWQVPFFDESGKAYYLDMTFGSGVAIVTLPAGTLQTGKYFCDQRSSKIARVTPCEIVVALAG